MGRAKVEWSIEEVERRCTRAGPCRLWKGALTKDGGHPVVGMTLEDGTKRVIRVARLVWALEKKISPFKLVPGKTVHSNCKAHGKKCVQFLHLRVGPKFENARSRAEAHLEKIRGMCHVDSDGCWEIGKREFSERSEVVKGHTMRPIAAACLLAWRRGVPKGYSLKVDESCECLCINPTHVLIELDVRRLAIAKARRMAARGGKS